MANTRIPILKRAELETPLGSMVAIASEEALYLLGFSDYSGLERDIELLQTKTASSLLSGDARPIDLLNKELAQYFAGTLKTFKTPYLLLGSLFQNQAWRALSKIPYGKTVSYAEQAAALGKPTAYRAVAQANSVNQLAIIIPCHRVINSNGKLGGYASGLARKEWLLNHER